MGQGLEAKVVVDAFTNPALSHASVSDTPNNSAKQPLEYIGRKQPKPRETDRSGQLRSPYLPSPELVEAVNLAIYLERPLLLKGEPGCGKTQLPRAVAYELGLPWESWYVKSTSRAQDGLYTYDAVGRLRDAQLAASGQLTAEERQRMADPATYIRWGALGRAFRNDRRTVVLIDEIDKADIDFPNDLLLELDEQRFFIQEVEVDHPLREVRAKVTPIVFITSNDEKDLPDAFLRRCLFHHVQFPDRHQLINIINAHFTSSAQELPQNLVQAAVHRFMELRQDMDAAGNMGKKVSTSELLDWVRVLHRHPLDDALAKLEGKLPYAGVLLKNWDDHVRYLQQK